LTDAASPVDRGNRLVERVDLADEQTKHDAHTIGDHNLAVLVEAVGGQALQKGDEPAATPACAPPRSRPSRQPRGLKDPLRQIEPTRVTEVKFSIDLRNRRLPFKGFDNDHLGTLMPFGVPSTPATPRRNNGNSYT
jgi:hypothetical protein